MLEGILEDAATGGSTDSGTYVLLRGDFMQHDELQPFLPRFVRSYRNLSAFWGWIKYEAGTYAERRKIISEGFTPLMDHL